MAGIAASSWQNIRASQEVKVRICGQTFDFGGAYARDWIFALDSRDPEEILPGLLDPDQTEQWRRIYFDENFLVTARMHQEIALAALEAASGFALPAALRLISTASANWHPFHGWAVYHSITDPLYLSLAGFCDLTYYFLTHNAEQKDLVRIDAELSRPLPGTPVKRPPKDWDEAGSAMAALAAHQAAKRAGRPA